MAAGGELLPGLEAQLRRLAERASETAALLDGLATLRRATGFFRDAALRETATESLFQDLLKIMKKVSHEIDVAYKDVSTLAYLDSHLLLLSECFRCLRNACVQCTSNQNVMRSLGLIDASLHVIQLLQKLETDLESLLIDRLDDVEIRALWGPYHHFQDSLFFTLKIVLNDIGSMFGVIVLLQNKFGANQMPP